ncbi:FAD-dependent monooxygenase [Verminephrobacter eiseniae]|uniref:Monooxygenase, FAD-binding n=1 Tax=Verminephrobacter eiseniae (strain EF01-2) TaxID=391735 RepID=A1WRS2_VEREI|nr:FAD-dependent monooxygenase [Verminephrobacter eiseniae]ABM60329.1 monooxygenase, FAD-binding [Verminephrobacter eiseniae EF01-2]MCW5285816.1 FAD-dependent oxidoreductase [Verminephrobacter eiseniae]MCW5304114.1 FAD-dependent oxidoreductase [Verminephrobacter eiseniae]MCW8178572.1 FAD-dependent oxidoreductase [Verminephrobacter eiseniae]MCW8189689.1 FAD-dependent oxidoreductase [Verminephrobacter eiseniae]
MPLEKIGPFEYRRFEPTLPAFDKVGHEAKRHQVLVVGGGPVGLATALGLANWGIRSVVVEADDSVCEGSRAACISRRSLEILERLGAVSPFLRKGLPWTRGRSFYGVQEVLVFDMPTGTGDKYPPMINLEQYYIEQYLLDSIDDVNARSPGMVEIRWASKVVECSPGSNGVELRVENALGNYQTEADWIVACDGGQSFVRSSLGLELKGIGYQGRYAIVDIELASDQPAERRAWFDPPWARGTTILMHRQPDDIWRVDYQLAAGLDAAQVLQPEQIRQFVQTHLDAIGEGHLPWTPVWTSLYRAGAMTLDAYRHGRILFAGNAAHAMPIFGVRGLNSGFDDADNLIWKLATVVKGLGTEALLDSYSSERVQAFHINAESAMRSTEFMSPPHGGFELMREACLSLAGRHTGIARLANPRQTHAITYAASPLSSDGRGGAGDWPLGAPLAEAVVPGGGHLTDLLARNAFTLLAFGPCPAMDGVAAAVESPDWPYLPCVCVTVQTDPAALPVPFNPPEGPDVVYLVRPDGHLCGRWDSPSAETVLAAIEVACGAEKRTLT